MMVMMVMERMGTRMMQPLRVLAWICQSCSDTCCRWGQLDTSQIAALSQAPGEETYAPCLPPELLRSEAKRPRALQLRGLVW